MILPVKKKKVKKKKSYFNNPKPSAPEKIIAKFFEDNNIKYVREKKFPGLLSMLKGELRFDFYIKDRNLLLEFDGPHHTSKQVYGKKSFVKTYINDKIKDSYAQRMNIDLIRINYTENLQERLKEIFFSKKVSK